MSKNSMYLIKHISITTDNSILRFESSVISDSKSNALIKLINECNYNVDKITSVERVYKFY